MSHQQRQAPALPLVMTLACAMAVGLGLCLVLGACSRSSGSPPVKTYTVRGQVRVIPSDRPELEIQHEAIPDFVNYKGEAVGMMAMVMPFGLGEGISLDGIEVGDKVEFTLAVDWDRKPAGYITRILELPADTPLVLE